MPNAYPKLHNAMWPGLVDKEPGTDHPPISLDRMLELTAAANVNGQKFEGVDLFLFHPHTDPDASDDAIRRAIGAIDAFKIDGKFSAERYEAALRGQGYGSVLLDAGLRRLHDNGVNGCVIDWTGLLDFYGRFGFQPLRAYYQLAKIAGGRR